MEEKEVSMNEEQFNDNLSKLHGTEELHLTTLNAVREFKSVRRAFRRGHCSLTGIVYPSRPFNNRANTSTRSKVHSRKENESRKKVYEHYTGI